jgi:superoxide dismutase, Fe-Mn family
VLHSLFWTDLSPDGGGGPEGALAETIDETFGGFEPFRQQAYDRQGNHGQGTIRKADFFEAAWNVVNWPDVAARFEAARTS